MADERYITQAEADAAKAKPIVTRGQPNQPPGIAPFFVEEIRKHLEQQYGAKVLYENGLSVTTTLDVKLQEAANRAIETGLRSLRQAPRLAAAGAQRDRGEDRPSTRSRTTAGTGRSRRATSCPPSSSRRPKTGPARLRLGRYHGGSRRAKASPGPGAPSAADLFKPGDLIDVRVIKIDEAAATASVTPRADAARGSRARGHRQPLRPDSRDGGRLELRPQQVQSRGAGLPAARIDLQADRLHGGDRSRLHARVHSHRRAGGVSRGQRARSTARRTTTTSSRGPSRCARRSRTRATFRRSR